MEIIKSSLAIKILNKLDIQENILSQTFENSTFVKIIGNIFNWIYSKTSYLTNSSNLIKNIDYSILAIISLILIAIPFTSTGIIGLLTFLAFVLLMSKFAFVKEARYRFTSFDLPIFLYIAIAGLSVLFSSLFFPSLKGYIKMVIYLGGYLTFASVLKDNPKRIIYLMVLLTITASIEAFYAIYQQIVGVEPLASWQDLNEVNPEQLMGRVYGTLKPFNPNLLAGYLIGSFSAALGLSFWFLQRKNFFRGLLALGGTAAILLAIVFTGSRGAYIGITVMMSLFVLISGHIIWHDFGHIKWLKKLWIAGILCGLAVVAFMIIASPALQHRILSMFVFRGDSSNSYRLNVYAASIKMFFDNWLIGIGPGNTTFRLIYGLYMVTGYDALGTYSVPLEVLVEGGIILFSAFAWLILLVFVKGTKYILSNNLLENRIIVSSCLIGVAGLMMHGLVDTIWYRPQVNLIFWMLIAILAVITSERFKQNSPK